MTDLDPVIFFRSGNLKSATASLEVQPLPGYGQQTSGLDLSLPCRQVVSPLLFKAIQG